MVSAEVVRPYVVHVKEGTEEYCRCEPDGCDCYGDLLDDSGPTEGVHDGEETIKGDDDKSNDGCGNR